MGFKTLDNGLAAIRLSRPINAGFNRIACLQICKPISLPSASKPYRFCTTEEFLYEFTCQSTPMRNGWNLTGRDRWGPLRIPYEDSPLLSFYSLLSTPLSIRLFRPDESCFRIPLLVSQNAIEIQEHKHTFWQSALTSESEVLSDWCEVGLAFIRNVRSSHFSSSTSLEVKLSSSILFVFRFRLIYSQADGKRGHLPIQMAFGSLMALPISPGGSSRCEEYHLIAPPSDALY